MFTGAQGMMEARKVKIDFVCDTKHLSVHRRNGHKDVHLVLCDQLKKFLGVVLPAVDDRRAERQPLLRSASCYLESGRPRSSSLPGRPGETQAGWEGGSAGGRAFGIQAHGGRWPFGWKALPGRRR